MPQQTTQQQPTQNPPAQATPETPEAEKARKQQEHEKAEQELNQEEHQRIMGVVPNFNTVNGTAAPLSPGQKFRLAFRSTVDPFQFVAAALDAGLSEAQDDYKGYGWGPAGYGKRFGAAYGDAFNGTIIGNAVLPVLFHQDARYYRMGTGKFSKRFWYALSTTVRCKGDNGKWQWNYSNVLGNFIAGGISNFYYDQQDRGVGLAVERGLTNNAEGALGSLFVEFWPDISARLHKHKNAPTAPAAPANP